MNDTPPHVNDVQLIIWLLKSLCERLKHFTEDNEALLLIAIVKLLGTRIGSQEHFTHRTLVVGAASPLRLEVTLKRASDADWPRRQGVL